MGRDRIPTYTLPMPQPPAQPPIATAERVALRFPIESDRDAFVALRQSSRAHLEPWEPIPPSGFDPYGPHAFDRELETHNTDREQRWFIIERETNALVGRIALTNIERGVFQNGRLGYWCGAGFQGQGLMTEALTLAVEHSFRPTEQGGLGLHRVCANIMPTNTRSRSLLQRVGFVKEGYSENYLQIQGKWEDHERWAMTIERHD
jgi:ribosomal-protein-alanine N-acetyltransferase